MKPRIDKDRYHTTVRYGDATVSWSNTKTLPNHTPKRIVANAAPGALEDLLIAVQTAMEIYP